MLICLKLEINYKYVQLKTTELISWHEELIHKDDKKTARKQEQQAMPNADGPTVHYDGSIDIPLAPDLD